MWGGSAHRRRTIGGELEIGDMPRRFACATAVMHGFGGCSSRGPAADYAWGDSGGKYYIARAKVHLGGTSCHTQDGWYLRWYVQRLCCAGLAHFGRRHRSQYHRLKAVTPTVSSRMSLSDCRSRSRSRGSDDSTAAARAPPKLDMAQTCEAAAQSSDRLIS